MIVDLNLKGKQVVVFGAGREAVRKLKGLIGQNCLITVIGEKISRDVRIWEEKKYLSVKKDRIDDGSCLNGFDDLILIIAATDDKQLNRRLVQEAKKLRCYSYAVDDPEVSDFHHPAIIDLYETVKVAVSTGGKSPLMARNIREKVERVLRETISIKDIHQIHLHNKIRVTLKEKIPLQEDRKRFLESLAGDFGICESLKKEDLDTAEKKALKKLDVFLQSL